MGEAWNGQSPKSSYVYRAALYATFPSLEPRTSFEKKVGGNLRTLVGLRMTS